jgi:aryl-alcohol dehydrogenase-like predicted oxidoreductase
LQTGLLTGKLDPAKIAPDDWRNRAPEFKEPNLSINLKFAQKLVPIASKYGKTVSQLAIAWVLRHPEITSAIVGSRRPAQVEETVGGAGWKLEAEDLASIDQILQTRMERIRNANGYVHPEE